MHHKQHLAAAIVIQRPPSITVTLQPETVAGIDQFVRNFGAGKGISGRSEAIQFLLDEAMPHYCKTAEPGESLLSSAVREEPIQPDRARHPKSTPSRSAKQ
jgi:hypothetical protein